MTFAQQGRPKLHSLFRDDPNLFASPPRPAHNDVLQRLQARPDALAANETKEKCDDHMPNRFSRRLQEMPGILNLSFERSHRRLPEARRNAGQAANRRRQEVVDQGLTCPEISRLCTGSRIGKPTVDSTACYFAAPFPSHKAVRHDTHHRITTV